VASVLEYALGSSFVLIDNYRITFRGDNNDHADGLGCVRVQSYTGWHKSYLTKNILCINGNARQFV
jgi:hypothetical protein